MCICKETDPSTHTESCDFLSRPHTCSGFFLLLLNRLNMPLFSFSFSFLSLPGVMVSARNKVMEEHNIEDKDDLRGNVEKVLV